MKRKHGSERFLEIEVKIRTGEYTCRLPADRKKHTATTWTSMRHIYDESEQVFPDFYYCSKCHIIFKLELRDSGKTLKAHVDSNCAGRAAVIDNFFAPEYQPTKKRKISVDDKVSVRDAAIAYVIQDMRPISSLNGDGMTSLLSKMTFIGARYGAFTEDAISQLKLIPSRPMVSYFVQNFPLSEDYFHRWVVSHNEYNILFPDYTPH